MVPRSPPATSCRILCSRRRQPTSSCTRARRVELHGRRRRRRCCRAPLLPLEPRKRRAKICGQSSERQSGTRITRGDWHGNARDGAVGGLSTFVMARRWYRGRRRAERKTKFQPQLSCNSPPDGTANWVCSQWRLLLPPLLLLRQAQLLRRIHRWFRSLTQFAWSEVVR
jgi:hypothetical protein